MSRPLSILLVDDDPIDRDLVKLELTREFEEVQFHEAGTPESLQEALEKGGFDIALIDYRLGWSDGLKVMSEVRGSTQMNRSSCSPAAVTKMWHNTR
jgi:CheY-like chemotaxis protein